MNFFNLFNPFYWASQLFSKPEPPEPEIPQTEYQEEFDDPSDQDIEATAE